METKIKKSHTPGPWAFKLVELSEGVDDAGNYINVHTKKDYYTIIAGEGFWRSSDNTLGFGLTGYMSKQNARLLAAAPDLLQACKDAFDYLHTLNINTGDTGDQVYQNLDLAIKKATQKI